MRFLGAERFLDSATVAVLISLWQNLIAEADHPTAADIMLIDTAIISYYNFLRVQGWIGNLSLTFERELFGQEPLSEIHGSAVGNQLRDHEPVGSAVSVRGYHGRRTENSWPSRRLRLSG